jgi:hypothetical protein
MGVLEKFAQKERYRELHGEWAKLRASPGGETLDREFALATDDLDINGQWGLFHQAKRRYETENATVEQLDCLAINLGNENKSGKLSGWRKETIEVLLAKYFDKNSTPQARRAYLNDAIAVRDEGTTNTYRGLGVRRRVQRWLISALAIVGLSFIVILAQHIDDTPNSRHRGHRSTQTICEPSTLETPESTGTSNETQPQPNPPLTAALTVDQQRQCLRSALRHGWIVRLSAIAGAVGAIASALRRTSRETGGTKRIPEVLASYLFTLSRVLLGAFAGLTFYLAYICGAIIFSDFDPVAVTVLGSFGFGFTERFFVIGEKPEKPIPDPPPTNNGLNPDPNTNPPKPANNTDTSTTTEGETETPAKLDPNPVREHPTKDQ